MTRVDGWMGAIAMGGLAVAISSTSHAEEAVDLTGDEEVAVEPAEDEGDISWVDAQAVRRCGFSVGVTFGGMLGEARGFPNDALRLGRDEFETQTGVAGGGQGQVWVGMVPVDWIAFGAGFGGGRLVSSEHSTGFGGVSFHLDVFPLFFVGGAWEDIGFMVEAGVGATSTTPTDDEDNTVIDSGAASRFTVGFFYEGIRAWKISMGPFLAYDGMWSPSAFQPTGWLGWRTALYAGP